MKDAIKLAIEGGYKVDRAYEEMILGDLAFIREDPLFWQALGKAMGWKDYEYWEDGEKKVQKMWLEKQHDFIDHLAEGKDAESFFKELLAN